MEVHKLNYTSRGSAIVTFGVSSDKGDETRVMTETKAQAQAGNVHLSGKCRGDALQPAVAQL